jgi:hypothetical protein
VIGIVTDTLRFWNRERSRSSKQMPMLIRKMISLSGSAGAHEQRTVLVRKIISLSANASANQQTHLLMRKRRCS